MYKDLRNYISSVRGENAFCLDVVDASRVSSAALTWTCLLFTDMREASRRLSQSLYDAYETDWAGEEDLGAIVEVSTIISDKLQLSYCTFVFYKSQSRRIYT